MKKYLFILMTAAFALCGAAEKGAVVSRFSPKAVSPRYAKVGEKPQHILALNGKAQCEILLAPKANRTVQYAASELASFLSQIIGDKVQVVPKATGKKTLFLLGEEGAKLVKADLKKIDRDGFIIKSAGNTIVIAGTDDVKGNPAVRFEALERGTLNGVYEFLERFGGVRFYFPGEMGTVVPRKNEWKIGSIDLADRPDNQHRRTYCIGMKSLGVPGLMTPGGMKEAELKRLSGLRIRESTLYIPNCHGLRGLQLVKRFAKKRPDFFALRGDGTRHDGSRIIRKDDADGQLCFTNDDLQKVVYEDAKAFLTGKAASTRNLPRWHKNFFSGPFFNIMPNDALYPCRCAKCVKARKEGADRLVTRQATSDHIWRFKAGIARKLQQENIPGYCTMMAYGAYKPIPSFDIPSNVIVMLALTGPWKELNTRVQERDIELLKAWQKKLNAKSYLWTYTTKIGNGIPAVPSFTPRAVGSFFKKAAPYSFGAFLEAEVDYWMFNSMSYYVFGKVLWNTDTDVDALFNEHFQLMFGAGAKEMAEVYASIERHWLKDIMANIKETPVGPQAVLPSQFEIWGNIYGPKEIARIEGLFDKAEKATAKDTMANKRVKFMRKELWGPVLEGMKQFHKKNNDNSVWTIYAAPVTKAPVIDGKLDDEAWKKADTVWLVPRQGEVNEVSTKVKMLCDKDYFYFAFENEEPRTDKMLCAVRQRDEINMWRDNLVELFIGPKRTDPLLYQFMLTSRGDVADLRKTPGHMNNKWNSGLIYKTGVIPGKMWVAEVKIPRASMPEIKGDQFVINFARGRVLDIPGGVKEHYYTWSKFRKQTSENCGTAIIGVKPASKSVVKDGDFDVKVRGKRFAGKWYTNKVIHLDDKVFRTCGSAVRLEAVAGSDLLRQYLTDFKPSTRYRFSFFVKLGAVKGKPGKPAAGLTTQIRFGGGGQSWFRPTQQAFTGTTNWRRLEYEFTTPADVGSKGKAYIEFRLSLNATGKVWLDHVEVVEVSSNK